METARSFFVLVMLILGTLFFGITSIITGVFARRPDLAHLSARAWAKVNLWTSNVTVQVKGLENIKPDQPYIYAANHQSAFDILAILGELPVQFRWLAKEELFKVPIFGQAMAAVGYIPIDRTDRRKAFESLERAANQVKQGTSIVIFPEGTRSPDGVLQDFKKGGFILAIRSQQPMVPISITGSYRIFPKKGRFKIRPGAIIMTIGKPIPTAGLTVKDRALLIHNVREAIRSNLPQREGGLLPDKEAIPSIAS